MIEVLKPFYGRLVKGRHDWNYATYWAWLLLLEATKRIAANEGKSAIPDADVMAYFGIAEVDLEEVEEPEIE